MTAVKSSSNVLGVTYTIFDLNNMAITFANGQPLLVGSNDPVRAASLPTILMLFEGTQTRFTVAQAITSPTVGVTYPNAGGGSVVFGTGVADYAGGSFQGANAGGSRLFYGGVFSDLTSGNLTDIGTVMTAFAAAGVVS